MSKEEHKQFNQEMVQKYIQQKEELQPQYDQLKRVNQQLEEIRSEFGIQPIKQVQPKLTTSFMQIKDANQRREYKVKVENIREQRCRARRGVERPYYANQDKENNRLLADDPKYKSSSSKMNADLESATKSAEKIFVNANGHNRSSSSVHRGARRGSHMSMYSKRSQSSITRHQSKTNKDYNQETTTKDQTDEQNEEYAEEVRKVQQEFDQMMLLQR